MPDWRNGACMETDRSLRVLQLTDRGRRVTDPPLSTALGPAVPQRCWGGCRLLLAECTCLDVGLARMAARS